MRAADLMVECLAAQGADRIFCVPGESYLALLDALRDDARIDTVVCRHEGGAGLMAVADAKLTGRPGVAAVSRGPGATNASIAIHLAQQDATPLVALIGQVARDERGRGAFQEVDYAAMFGTIAKAVWEVADADHLPEVLARAWQTAQAGTPGPVVISLPEDMLGDETSVPVVPPLPLPSARPAADEVARAAALLARAERPLLIAGGALAHGTSRAALARAAAAHQIPVALTFKRQEIFDNASPLFAGHLGFKIPRAHVEALARADLVLAVGTRLGDTPTQGYTFPRAPVPDQPLIHVYPDPGVVGRLHRAEIALACDPTAFLEALAASPATPSEARSAWAAETGAKGAATKGYAPRSNPDGVDFGAVVAELARNAPPDTVITTDAGNFSSWVHRVWPWDGGSLAIGAAGGAMGLGIPGAVAACLRLPDRRVIAFSGDGGAMMTGNELATARAAGARPIIVIANNGSYGTIRQHQERAYPHRTAATDLANPDFAAWGAAFGALGLTISRDDEAPAAVARALAHDGPVVIDARTSLEAISANATLTALRTG
ncbi:acetolactate synthase [Limibaculum sp. M0105]|uniref:Acetolactate synthase n=1 Tax=Thermohalobaculum xanthum TaxID=2753746 RepID=A0A8J7M9R8_9RHOB|nr:thiamine pyrophosphate-dependent enzyme [Thermohalobaculum xanthum]MBK0400252.1 acetolactate synthase [Thermohalobaculum xanthum]